MAVKFENVSFTYLKDTPFKKDVLRNISEEFPSGKITAIVGPNGSGKSTLAALIDALVLPTEGKITVDDIETTPTRVVKKINMLRNKVGLAFQFPEEQFFQPTVYQEIAFGMKHFKYKVANKQKRIIDALALVGLGASYLERDPFELSGGEKRKVAIASILAFNPKVIILDEPTVGLDDKNKEMLMKVLIKLKNTYDKTVIIISHDVDLMYRFVDKVVLLKEGKIIKSGSKYEVFKNVEQLKMLGIEVPKIAEFTEMVSNKTGRHLGHYDDLKEIMKAVYRDVK